MKLVLPAFVLLLMSIETLASTTNSQTNINNGPGSPKQGGRQTGNPITTSVKVSPRNLMSLFQRDPDFEFAMGILARNAAAAEKTVDEIVADIKKGTVDPEIVNAALAKGLIIKAPGFTRRSSALEARATIKGPKGMPHTPNKVAQHIASNGYIPPKIMDALLASKHYLRPGQTPSNPTAPPKGKAAGQGTGRKQVGATPNGKKVGGRDLEGLYIRDIDNIYAREAEPEVTREELKALIHATQRNPDAEKAVYHALTMDRNVEKVTEDLVKDWTTKEDMEKRDAIVDAYLEARAAEADYLEVREAEADYLEAREAEAEAEAEWEE